MNILTTGKLLMPPTTSTTTTTRKPCSDYHRLCSYWAEKGQCDENPFWMRPQCQKSCLSCGETLEDVHSLEPKPSNKDNIFNISV